MSPWRRALTTRRCGRCPTRIAIGEPYRELCLPGITLPKVRCKKLDCAGEPVPDTLPPLERPGPLTLPAWTGLGQMGLNLKLETREPGEEG